jgi:hypothetical protein
MKETARKHATIIAELLALHAITGCDTVAGTYGNGKTKVITVSRKGYTLDQLGHPTADIVKVFEQATAFMGALLRRYNTILFHGEVAPAVVGAEEWEISSGTEATEAV